MDTLNTEIVRSFFNRVVAEFPLESNVASMLVTHLLPDRPFFIAGVENLTSIISIIPKPKSIHRTTMGLLSQTHKVDCLSREQVDDPEKILSIIEERLDSTKKLVLLDIGGYFTTAVTHIENLLGDRFLGIIEDTENGLQKYQQLNLKKPVISVARSPLKNPEDFLVGHSIVFSVEALLREQGDILHGRTACVIGYGKLGRSIAHLLNARNVQTIVYDKDPIRTAEAMAHGFRIARNLNGALQGAMLVFCATGNMSISADNFHKIQSGAYLATVTSSDDELELSQLRQYYTIRHVSDYITEYKYNNHCVYVMNRGQAVNFIHGAAVGPFIYLVQSEILASISRLEQGDLPVGISENTKQLRQVLAGIWLDVFGNLKD